MRPPVQATRRRLLTAGAALAGLGLAGCAAPASTGPSIGRVVIIGGGYGGCTAARYLRLWGGNIDVTLVERGAQFVSCPISNLVLAGWRQMADITHSYEGLRTLGVKVVQGDVVAVDPAARRLRLASGAELVYDRLVVSPGVDFMTSEIGGLDAALAGGRVVHAWKAGPQTVALRAQLQGIRDGGVYAISVPRAPYRCPPAPYERACLVASYFKAAKPRSKVLVLDANPEVQSKKALFERVFNETYKGMIEYRPNSELKEITGSADAPIARFEFEDLRADVLNVVPPQRGGDVARQLGLLNLNQRWAGVDWLSMESTVVPGVHVLGDATFAAPAMPKSGHMANQHGKVAAAAIIQLLQGLPVNPEPMLANTCYSFVDERQAMHVATVHRYDAGERTFKTVPGAGGLSAAASTAEGAYAQSWADNIWADMLGT